MARAVDAAATVTVRYRTAPDTEVSPIPLADLDPTGLAAVHPWREFRWYRGQRHYSGTYWSATEGQHVIYESRLELARLLFADFDRSVHGIRAQPFLLTATMREGVVRKHIPDYLLITDQGLKVVDVKPAHRLSKPEVASTFDWTRSAIEGRGWIYEVWSEPDMTELQNVRFLAGYRRRSLFDPVLLEALGRTYVDGRSIAQAIAGVADWPEPQTRAALLHLLWSHEFGVEMSRTLSPGTILTRER